MEKIMKARFSFASITLAVFILTGLACNFLTQGGDQVEQAPTSVPQANQPTREASVAEPAITGTIQQWASSAIAGSQYGESDWSASQATGEPNTPECGDIGSAWASADSASVDWLEARFDVPVIPSRVNIYESNSPSQVVKVEMIDTAGGYHEVYSATPKAEETCPFVLSIQVNGADYQAIGVKITIDQSILDLPWNEIDAVELVGAVGG
jgi:hypothetical protein